MKGKRYLRVVALSSMYLISILTTVSLVSYLNSCEESGQIISFIIEIFLFQPETWRRPQWWGLRWQHQDGRNRNCPGTSRNWKLRQRGEIRNQILIGASQLSTKIWKHTNHLSELSLPALRASQSHQKLKVNRTVMEWILSASRKRETLEILSLFPTAPVKFDFCGMIGLTTTYICLFWYFSFII